MRYSEVGHVLRDPFSGAELRKSVFVIFYQGEFVKSKISKICESFGANIYPVPDTQSSRRQLLDQTRVRLEDLQIVLDKSLQMRQQSMQEVRPQLEEWQKRILKEKATYHTLNLFNYDIGRKCLIGQAWCSRLAIEDVQVALRRATVKSGAVVPSILTIINTNEHRPTYFRTNKFTRVFQDIISAYGVPSYQEINPSESFVFL
jgi:V-type H+-transporting ATPase subunit a